jgi:REP element-mobilizing transposase RayT
MAGNITMEKSKTFYRLVPKSLPVMVRSFKSICTKTINQKFPDINFSWQSKYYDHIIRNEKSLNEIRKYICENPQKWDLDKNNVDNLYM